MMEQDTPGQRRSDDNRKTQQNEMKRCTMREPHQRGGVQPVDRNLECD
jgi:hypothetical protein